MILKKIDKYLSSSFKKALKTIEEDVIPVLKDECDRVHYNSEFPSETFNKIKEKKLLSTIIDSDRNYYIFNVYDHFYFTYLLSKVCASAGMIYAMHIAQLHTIYKNKILSKKDDELNIFIENQLLIASATSEIGKGGDVSRSIATIEKGDNDTLYLMKKCSVISYADYADGILLTANSFENKQIFIYIDKSKYKLKLMSKWDAMGLRGTCSNGYVLEAKFHENDILSISSKEIVNNFIMPYSHILWAACWFGIASNSFEKTLVYYKLNTISNAQISEIYNNLLLVENSITLNLINFEKGRDDDFMKKLELTSLKSQVSELCINVCLDCLKVLGINGYINDSKYSITRNIADSLSSIVMINNNRINNSISESLKILKT
ncbi:MULTISPECIES: acyl-CoA dehydrogenase family protein [unclassified Acinetobacter]|uniref:acyl-CoA dehydrogenase family protein n=1 Tax=unclassified Acinetobacter TaxID=196816 RepID=UPI002934B92D|nr:MULTISPECIES: acyl-CoA dehydrogenase family protein [unclassified Acinetobacter]WOE33280.1 acyl-CoA dehydrogenase family protein [Acinetobacter sp. SAAs470]WOE36939.1 acyl-CoA dehydrogenase family protein [Acinetobacter sp. SAAs474]